jgi:hypothetical protein
VRQSAAISDPASVKGTKHIQHTYVITAHNHVARDSVRRSSWSCVVCSYLVDVFLVQCAYRAHHGCSRTRQDTVLLLLRSSSNAAQDQHYAAMLGAF